MGPPRNTRRIANTTLLLLMLAVALLATAIAAVQATVDGDHSSSFGAHPAERSDVHGLSSLADWSVPQLLTSSTEAIPAPNDSCHEPISVTLLGGSNYSIAVDTTAATTDPNDPLQGCTIGGPAANAKSVWWLFQVPQDGELTISTISANPKRYDTVITLYPADIDCESLSPADEIACDDDIHAFQSKLTALVDAGQFYLAEVTGWGADNPGGELDLVAYFETNTHWQAPPGAGMPRRLHRHIATTDGWHLYLIGGQAPELSSSVYDYDPETATWRMLSDIPSPYSNSDGTYLDGRIYIPSGYAGGDPYQPYQGIHYTYVITDDTWLTSAPMTATVVISEPIAWGAVAADPDRGLYYHTGGRYGTDPGQPLSYTLEYDTHTDSWRALPPLTTPRYAHQAVVLDGRLCVAGGLDQDAQPMTSGECFDPLSETWSPIAEMYLPRAMFGSAVSLDGNWVVFGGLTVNTMTATLTTPKTEVFDPHTGSWTLLSQHWSLNLSRSWLTGTTIGNHIFATGGFLPAKGLVVDSLERLALHRRGPFSSVVPVVGKGLPSGIGTLHEPNDAIPFAFGPLSGDTDLESDFGLVWDTEDFFFFVTAETADIEVHLTQIPARSNYDLFLFGTDEMGTPKYLYAASQRGSNLDESLSVSQAPPGQYYIRIQNVLRIPNSQRYLLQLRY